MSHPEYLIQKNGPGLRRIAAASPVHYTSRRLFGRKNKADELCAVCATSNSNGQPRLASVNCKTESETSSISA